ncbi:Uncharacterised protein [Vibrio cholerae]|uniref:Uncharacterized protein n=1 Tax=Vibrio cholerae TaxID=666 RepID=A0A655PX03_VIBCL|nr:Uncharacterised protein [Vibrio cholerae]CSB34601.1 Uncharacterised protein [Vibrio cholerae]
MSSIKISCWPFWTCSPSRTRICLTSPPSKFWITCTCEEGTTLPWPTVTLSISAHDAQAIARIKNATMTQRMIRALCGVLSSSAAVLSST